MINHIDTQEYVNVHSEQSTVIPDLFTLYYAHTLTTQQSMSPIINYWAVLVSAVALMGLGALWYGPVFGNVWKKLEGLTDEAMRKMPLSPLQAMLGGFITTLLLVFVFAHVHVFATAFTGATGVAGGLQCAFWMWLGFALPLTAGSFLWSGKSWKLWVLNAGYYFVGLMIAGAIIGGWTV